VLQSLFENDTAKHIGFFTGGVSAMAAGHFGQFSLPGGNRWFVLAAAIYFAATPPASAQSTVQPADSQQLTQAIDRYFERYWASQGLEPAQPADDAEFVRRANLDFAGKIPPVSEVRSFLADANSSKREELVDRLLARGGYSRHFANLWSAVLLSGAADNAEIRALAPRLETWLRLRFAANLGFDQIAAELLAAPPGDRGRRALQNDAIADPTAFFQAADRKPEQLAASTSRVFLGLQVQCAQCHDHPHTHWTRQEFWSFAALFAEYASRDGDSDAGNADTDDSGTIANAANDGPAMPPGLKIPDTDIFAPASFLDGGVPEAVQGGSRRAALVRWLTARENRWFSQAIVNRVWEQLLGRGLIDPADDLEAAGPNDHAELLTLLAADFTAHNYDLQYLLRAIAGTRLYRMSSQRDPARPTTRHQFARMSLRKMTAEQLFDSLVQATGLREARSGRASLADVDSMRGSFRQKFADPSVARTEAETSILQALALMNGKLVVDATDLKQGETLAAVVSAPFLNTSGKVEALFMATLSRPPSAEEKRQFGEYVDARGSGSDAGAALADVFWALLNSAEFVLVH
jgi:hypothetical protein